MSRRRYTLLLVPEDSRGQTRRLEVTDALVRRLVAASGGLLLLASAVGVGLVYLALGGGDAAAGRLSAENVALRLRLQGLDRMAGQAQAALDRLQAEDARIRGLTHSDDAVRPYGIGPLSEVEMDRVDAAPGTASPPPSAGAGAGSLEDRLRALIDSARARQVSLEEVAAYLDDRHSVLRGHPTAWPVEGWLTSGYGPRTAPMPGASTVHRGVDITASFGAPVIATADGIIAYAGWSDGYGQLVVVDHGFGLATRYGHNSELLVQPGDRVQRGQVVARVGSTGRSTGPHVHYEVHRHGVPVDPQRFLARVDDGGGGGDRVD